MSHQEMFAGITEKPPKKTRSKPRKKVLTAPAVLPAFKSEPIGQCPLSNELFFYVDLKKKIFQFK